MPDKLTPYLKVDRKGSFGAFVDSEGNQCGLLVESYSPCQLENHEPNWKECPFNTKESRENLAKIIGKVRIFPNEFKPQKSESWKGILMRNWIEYINNNPNH